MAINRANAMIRIDEREFRDASRYLRLVSKSLDKKWFNKTLKSKAAPIIEEMKVNSPSKRLAKMTGSTTSKKRSGGIRLGVIKNDPELFPKFSAQATAAVNEYGTVERSRKMRGSTGQITPKPYLRPAWMRGRNTMINNVVNEIKKRIP
jgi:hypothetical protein